MAELRISRVHVERAPVLEPERHPPVVGRRHLRGPAIDEAERAIVAGSADAVADAELDALGPVDLGAAPASADLGGLPEHQAVLAAVEQHGAAPVEKVYNVMLPVLPKEAQPSANCGRGRLRWAGRDAIRRPTAGNGVENGMSAIPAAGTTPATAYVRTMVADLRA